MNFFTLWTIMDLFYSIILITFAPKYIVLWTKKRMIWRKIGESAKKTSEMFGCYPNFFYICNRYATGQVLILVWSGYHAKKQEDLVDTCRQYCSVSWNLVNLNVEWTEVIVWASLHQYMVWIPLSHFLFYGFYQSLTYKKVWNVGVRTILFLYGQ